MSRSGYFYDPFQSISAEFNRLFDAAWDARNPNTGRELQRRDDSQPVSATLRPRMDLHESRSKNEVTATFELPGMKKEDVNIDVHNDRLVISGQSTISSSLENDGYAVRERRFGRFTRTVPLPSGTKAEQVKASMENGILTVKFPKTQSDRQAKRITIS